MNRLKRMFCSPVKPVTPETLPDIVTTRLLESPARDSPVTTEADHTPHLEKPSGITRIHHLTIDFQFYDILTDVDVVYQNFWWNNKCKIHALSHNFRSLCYSTLYPIKPPHDDVIVFIISQHDNLHMLYYHEDENELYRIPGIEFLSSQDRDFSDLRPWGSIRRESLGHMNARLGCHFIVERCDVLKDKKKCESYLHNKIHERPNINQEQACSEIDSHIENIADHIWEQITYIEFIINTEGHVIGFSGMYLVK